MNAFLLAAGLGTRLRPLTDETPKCLVDICGKPLLQWWMEKLERSGVNRVLINTHHLAEKLRNFVDSYICSIDVVLFHEKELRGSAGTVRDNKGFIENDNFLIIYADNLTDVCLNGIVNFHKKNRSAMTMGVMEMPKPETRGIAVLDKNGVIIDFAEKSPDPPGNLANAGIIAASPLLYDYLDSNKTPLDFGFDILPKLAGKIYGYKLEGYLQDIGNPDDLESARMKWGNIINKQQSN